MPPKRLNEKQKIDSGARSNKNSDINIGGNAQQLKKANKLIQ